jgi:hypothetical protein
VLRSGRQALVYGSQRLISPPDFANVHRNWEGFRVLSPGDTWNFDAFVTCPINAAEGALAARMPCELVRRATGRLNQLMRTSTA